MNQGPIPISNESKKSEHAESEKALTTVTMDGIIGCGSSFRSDLGYRNIDLINTKKKIDPHIPIEERSNEQGSQMSIGRKSSKRSIHINIFTSPQGLFEDDLEGKESNSRNFKGSSKILRKYNM